MGAPLRYIVRQLFSFVSSHKLWGWTWPSQTFMTEKARCYLLSSGRGQASRRSCTFCGLATPQGHHTITQASMDSAGTSSGSLSHT